ncbi:uncharacterized protein LOC126680066 [Mercurialis annua]|uniref:uncharacterized protein LOC126680066 n=1 Tax=Mercurialis annua TaxID=3986 RepID=UPI00215FDD4D|nr:uncharacterized protein LOC126680066 [Mercurialis annua]
MAHYIDEEDVWKCPKHPSKRRRTGICHVCLRERLSSLCPHCAKVRPCSCSATTTTAHKSSADSFVAEIGTVGRVSNLIDGEPAFRRSRSVAIPFLRSKPSVDSKDSRNIVSSSSFWSRFRSGNSSRREAESNLTAASNGYENDNNKERRRSMMRKSRSVAVTSESAKSAKGRGWYFPSPIKAFRQSISRGIMVHERSPLHRG